MKIVIDIPEEDYRETKMQIVMAGGMIETLGGRLKCAVASGTVLPKGHGRLIDAKEAANVMLDEMCGTGYQANAMRVVESEFYTTTIVAADTGVET